MNHCVSQSCKGERCFCGQPATHKVEETIFDDDESAWTSIPGLSERTPTRHPFTAYVCCKCFRRIMGPAVFCPIKIVKDKRTISKTNFIKQHILKEPNYGKCGKSQQETSSASKRIKNQNKKSCSLGISKR
jgi:hypothetical protein